MNYKGFYHIAGVAKKAADDKEIRRAYQNLAHPHQRGYSCQLHGRNVNLNELVSNGRAGRFSECFPQIFRTRHHNLLVKISLCVPTQQAGNQWHLYEQLAQHP